MGAHRAEIELFRFLGDSAGRGGGCAASERPLTGEAARTHLAEESKALHMVAGLLKTTVDEVPGRIVALVEERRKLERDLSDARKKLAMGGGGAGSGADDVREIVGVKLMARVVEGVAPKDLKSLVDEGKRRIGSGVVAIVGVSEDGKAGVVVGVTPDLTERYDAVALVRAASEALGGKGGGGRPDMAQAGGPDGAKAQAALEAVASSMG